MCLLWNAQAHTRAQESCEAEDSGSQFQFQESWPGRIPEQFCVFSLQTPPDMRAESLEGPRAHREPVYLTLPVFHGSGFSVLVTQPRVTGGTEELSR